MFLQTHDTPNPNTMKFIPDGIVVIEKGVEEFKNKEVAAEKSNLAEKLFAIQGVKSVFLGHDFITVTKDENLDWQYLKTEILSEIMDFFVSGQDVLKKSKELLKQENSSNEEDNEIVKQIKELIEIKVRPAVAMDGGDIIFHSFEDGVVNLILKGSCSGCPSSTITLKNGIENMLKHYIPEVVAVEQVMED
jgi:Fe-S cluster biogenesis protein NfuA